MCRVTEVGGGLGVPSKVVRLTQEGVFPSAGKLLDLKGSYWIPSQADEKGKGQLEPLGDPEHSNGDEEEARRDGEVASFGFPICVRGIQGVARWHGPAGLWKSQQMTAVRMAEGSGEAAPGSALDVGRSLERFLPSPLNTRGSLCNCVGGRLQTACYSLLPEPS